MKLKRLIFFAAVLLSVLSCYADNGDHGFPKAWEKWRAELEKDSGKVVAYSVKRDWVLYAKKNYVDEDEWESCYFRNMRKNKDLDLGIIVLPFFYSRQASLNPLPVNIDTCKTGFVIDTGSAIVLQTISRDGRALLETQVDRAISYTYYSLETGKSKTLSDGCIWVDCSGKRLSVDRGKFNGFDSDSTFYFYETAICDKKGNVVSLDKVFKFLERWLEERNQYSSTANLIHAMGANTSYEVYYRKVRYNTKGEKLSVGNPIKYEKLMEEYGEDSKGMLELYGWTPKLYDVDGREVDDERTTMEDYHKRDSLIAKGDYTYYYYRQDRWADVSTYDYYHYEFMRYTIAAVLFLEKQKWCNDDEIFQGGNYIADSNTMYYRWMPVLCDAQGRVASDAAIFPIDGDRYTINHYVDVKDVEEALRAGKMQYLYRRMWYDDKNCQYDYIGCDAKLYTKDEVAAIEKNRFRWPDEWPAK